MSKSFSSFTIGEGMTSQIQKIAAQNGISHDEFVGEMRKRSCSEATAAKIWSGCYENFENFTDNDVNLSNLTQVATLRRTITKIHEYPVNLGFQTQIKGRTHGHPNYSHILFVR